MEKGEPRGNWFGVYPIIKLEIDRPSIPNYPLAILLKKREMRADLFPYTRAAPTVPQIPEKRVPEIPFSKPDCPIKKKH